MTTIFIGMPAFGGMNYTGLTHSLLKLQEVLAVRECRLSFNVVANCASQPAGRGYPITRFLDETDAEYYLSLDADAEFEPDQILRLIDADFDLCAATCGTKKEPSRLVINYLERPAQVCKGFVEAKDLGLACVLMKRAAVERIAEQFPRRVLHNGNWIVTWFFPFAEGQHYISCDAAFYWHWRECGGRTWVDLRSDMGHWGTHIFHATFDAPPEMSPVEPTQAKPIPPQQWTVDVGSCT